MNVRDLLPEIERNDENYDERARLVWRLLVAATDEGMEAGVRIDPSEPGWPVAYVELPTGQVSWHMPQHPHPWDQHTSAEKYARCRAYSGAGE